MVTLKEFQVHYGITDDRKAKAEYQRYLEALDIFKRLDEKREALRPEDAETEDLNAEEKP